MSRGPRGEQDNWDDEPQPRRQSMSLKPVCVPCQRFYRLEKNGYMFLEGMPKGNGALVGKDAGAHWRPYKLWVGDKWKCHGCGSEIVVGVAGQPCAEHYQDDFTEMCDNYKPAMQVNDC